MPVGDVDTLPKEFDEKRVNQVLRGVFTSLQRSRRGGLRYDSELGVSVTATMSMCVSPGALGVKVLHSFKKVTVLARGGLELRRCLSYLEPVGVEFRPREVYIPAGFLDTCSN